MVQLRRVAAWRQDRSQNAIVLGIGNRTLRLRWNQVSPDDTGESIEEKIRAIAVIGGIELPPIFVHRNRDLSFCMATGELPDAWPEDSPGTEHLEPKG